MTLNKPSGWEGWTGTVIEVARKMGRSGLGFEISEEYVKKYCGERLAQGVFNLKTEEK